LVRQWGNLGFLCSGERQKVGGIATGEFVQPDQPEGPYKDEQDPTLVIEAVDGRLSIGAGDTYSGLKSLVITLNDQDVTNRFTLSTADDVWSCGEALRGKLVAIAMDNHGNVTRSELMLPNGPDNSAEIAATRR
jgi:hypothetical protein